MLHSVVIIGQANLRQLDHPTGSPADQVADRRSLAVRNCTQLIEQERHRKTGMVQPLLRGPLRKRLEPGKSRLPQLGQLIGIPEARVDPPFIHVAHVRKQPKPVRFQQQCIYRSSVHAFSLPDRSRNLVRVTHPIRAGGSVRDRRSFRAVDGSTEARSGRGGSLCVTGRRSENVCIDMATIGFGAIESNGRLTRVVREWWPVPVFIAPALFAQQVLLTSRYDVGGHASEHLASASIPFMAGAVLAILLWATPLARRQADVLACVAAWFSATVVMMVGNLRVVDDLVIAGYSQTPTSSVPDVADHALANSSVWYGVAAALLLVAAFRWRRHVGNRTTIGAAIVTVLFPPWIIPGAGVLVLAIARCVSRHRSHSVPRHHPRTSISAARPPRVPK